MAKIKFLTRPELNTVTGIIIPTFRYLSYTYRQFQIILTYICVTQNTSIYTHRMQRKTYRKMVFKSASYELATFQARRTLGSTRPQTQRRQNPPHSEQPVTDPAGFTRLSTIN